MYKRQITDNELTDYVAVIMLFIIALNIVFYEKSENQLALLRTTARGRRQLMASKSFVMIMAVILITLLLYLSLIHIFSNSSI